MSYSCSGNLPSLSLYREVFWNARSPETLLNAGIDSRRILEACDDEIALVKEFVLGPFRDNELR